MCIQEIHTKIYHHLAKYQFTQRFIILANISSIQHQLKKCIYVCATRSMHSGLSCILSRPIQVLCLNLKKENILHEDLQIHERYFNYTEGLADVEGFGEGELLIHQVGWLFGRTAGCRETSTAWYLSPSLSLSLKLLAGTAERSGSGGGARQWGWSPLHKASTAERDLQVRRRQAGPEEP